MTQDPEKGSTPQFPSATSVPPFEAVFTSPDRHSPSVGLLAVAEYDQTTLGSVSIQYPAPARKPSDGSSYSQNLKRSGSNGSDRSTVTSSATHKTYAVAGSHHALIAAHRHQNSMSSGNSKRGWVIE